MVDLEKTKIFVRKFECAVNQIIVRKFTVGHSTDGLSFKGKSYFLKGTIISPLAILLEGRGVVHPYITDLDQVFGFRNNVSGCFLEGFVNNINYMNYYGSEREKSFYFELGRCYLNKYYLIPNKKSLLECNLLEFPDTIKLIGLNV